MLKTQTERAGDEESTLDAYAKQPSTLSNPKVAGATGDALIGYGHYAQAIPLSQAAESAGGADMEKWIYRLAVAQARSEERLVGIECVSPCRYVGTLTNNKKK